MATYYVDPSDVPEGTKLPLRIDSLPKNLPAKARGLVGAFSADGQIGLYKDGPAGEFIGYAIREGGACRFEPAEEQH